MKLTTDFDKLSFHDASIESIVRKRKSIILRVNGSFISKEHPLSENHDWKVEEAVLELADVTEEMATYWDDDKTSKEHPDPEFR